MLPLPDGIVCDIWRAKILRLSRPRQDIRATAALTDVHSKVPSITFTGWIGTIRIALINNPTGSAGAVNTAVVDKALTALHIPHRPDPCFKRERNTCAIVGLIVRGNVLPIVSQAKRHAGGS